MLEDVALGWYGFNGKVYVSLRVAEDPELLMSVLNHEDTHRTMCATTSHGLLQEALDLTRDFENAEPPARAGEICSALLTESRFLQEATATYCGLILLDPAERATHLKLLPEMYSEGWRLYNTLFAKYDFEPMEALRLARAFGCRAMQTSVLLDWDIKQLSDPNNLRKYLEEPENSPNKRFKILLEYFGNSDKDALVKFCGGHAIVGSDRLLMPPSQPAIDRIEFSKLPPLEAVRAKAELIVSDLFPEGSSSSAADETRRTFIQLIGRVEVAEVSLQPATFPAIDSTTDKDKWLSNADLVLVDRHIFDRPIGYETIHGKDILGANTARLYFRKPDSLSALKYTISAEQLPGFLTEVDPHEHIAVAVMGSTTWLPPTDEIKTGMATSANPFRAWAGGRPTMLYTGSTRHALFLYCNMLNELSGELIINPVQTGTTWGLILIRSSVEVWPMVVHPTLISEWNRIQNLMFEMFSFRFNLPPLTFFENEQTAMAIVRFARAYQGLTFSAQYWEQFSKVMTANFLTPGIIPDPQVRGVAYRNDL